MNRGIGKNIDYFTAAFSNTDSRQRTILNDIFLYNKDIFMQELH